MNHRYALSRAITAIAALILCSSDSLADVVVNSNKIMTETEVIGGGGATPVAIGPIVMNSANFASNTVDNTLESGVQNAENGLGEIMGTGSGTGIAQGNSAVDVGLLTISGDLASIAQFTASGPLGVGFGESDASITIVFVPTADTGYTLDAALIPVLGALEGGDAFSIRRTSQLGNPFVHLINTASQADIVGANGTFIGGVEYTIFMSFSNVVSGGSELSPGDEQTTGNFQLVFEAGSVIQEKCHVADINNDNVVDTADLGILLGAFGTNDHFADINGDGVVDTADLGILLGAFGASCP